MIWIAVALYVLGAALAAGLYVAMEGHRDGAFLKAAAAAVVWPFLVVAFLLVGVWCYGLHEPDAGEWRWRRRRDAEE